MTMHTIPRANHVTATLVDNGIVMANMFGTRSGARYLRDHGVPMSVTMRVLTRPDQRRA